MEQKIVMEALKKVTNYLKMKPEG
jgi:hypothetical protein